MHKLKARIGAWVSLLGLPLFLLPMLLLEDPPAGDPPAGDPPEGDPPRTFTQAEVDRILGERLARAKAAPPADYDELKAKAARLDEMELASKSALEQAQERERMATERATAAEAARSNTMMETAVLLAASQAGAVKPQQVFALLPKNAVTVGDDGQVTGVEEAVKAFLAENKHLVGSSSTPTGDGDGGGRGESSPAQLSRDDLKTMNPDEIVKAKAEGRLNDLLGVS